MGGSWLFQLMGLWKLFAWANPSHGTQHKITIDCDNGEQGNETEVSPILTSFHDRGRSCRGSNQAEEHILKSFCHGNWGSLSSATLLNFTHRVFHKDRQEAFLSTMVSSNWSHLHFHWSDGKVCPGDFVALKLDSATWSPAGSSRLRFRCWIWITSSVSSSFV